MITDGKFVFIPHNTPSLKNAKQIIQCGGRPRLIPSATHRRYESETCWYWKQGAESFKALCIGNEKPYKVGFYFIRDSQRKFDFTSPTDTCQDMMVKHGWIEDDNMTEIIPVILGYEVNKEKAGVLITIL